MSGTSYLLDTCFILGLYNGNVDALAKMAGVNLNECTVSIINEIELLGYQNINSTDEQELKELLNHLTILGLDTAVKSKTIELRKRHKIKLPDAIVLATALTHNVELLSLDTGLMNKYQQEIYA
ncbi:type II toxin-antitoxin system VapC family toxin [Moraxella nasicaprae]|uniref:Type II toxin-antitoxin system VapC family toxin n=1 Tax=Moraxella nasicaprae TaxID=2904122 RepID=A0ABY6F5E6_9GAMM|nr:type II toxin-antitoxin system VapC family toxin [Moraxella nasicaprae]UXZ05310.1 type II toxin-antitoxin system VapC family toxin [Moraxella nasicaprae]